MQEWAEQMADKYIEDDDDDPDGQLLYRQLGNVASTVLAEHAADDDESVSDEWFQQVLGEPQRRMTGDMYQIPGQRLWLFQRCDDEWGLTGDNRDICDIKTRGQFRQLCRALGIELKENGR